MKVLFVIDGLRKGGKERRFLQLINNLADNNIDYRIIIFHKEISYEITDGILKKIIYIDKRRKKSLLPFFTIYNFAKDFRPDFIHSWSFMVTFYSLLSVIVLNIKLINSQITHTPLSFKWFSFYSLICKINFLFSYKIISNSKSGLLSHNVKSNNSLVIPNGFDFKRIGKLIDKDSIKQMYSISTSKVVCMVANFTFLKDYNTYLNAAKNVITQFPDITFLCVGEGYKNFKENLSPLYYGKILFLGSQNDIESIINISDICVLSSFSEGMSNTILEYMALSKPVIASNVGGNPEIVKHNMNGFLFAVSNHNELSKAILRLVFDEKLAKQLGENGKMTVASNFSNQEMVQKYIQVYFNR